MRQAVLDKPASETAHQASTREWERQLSSALYLPLASKSSITDIACFSASNARKRSTSTINFDRILRKLTCQTVQSRSYASMKGATYPLLREPSCEAIRKYMRVSEETRFAAQ